MREVEPTTARETSGKRDAGTKSRNDRGRIERSGAINDQNGARSFNFFRSEMKAQRRNDKLNDARAVEPA